MLRFQRFRSWFRARREASRIGMGRTIALAAMVGVASGIAAVVFHIAVDFIAVFVMGAYSGYEQGGPDHEVGVFMPHASVIQIIPWMLVLLPMTGGLISGLLTRWFAPDASGPGTDAAIRAYHQQRGIIPLRVPFVKLLASSITLGTGGSGGREGPIAQIGAGFGSFLGTRLGLSDSERRILLCSGLGSGIGAIFHAPLAGSIFAVEVLYRDPDFEAEALIPAFIATVVSYTVFSAFFGFGAFRPLFEVSTDVTQVQPLTMLLPFAVLAIVMALASLLFVRLFYVMKRSFDRSKMPAWTKPMVGGMLTGMMGLMLYLIFLNDSEVSARQSLNVMASGYEFLQAVLSNGGSSIGLALLLAVGLGKMVTTGFTIGSGGSAGKFGPCMVIGGSLGAAVGLLFHNAGWVGAEDVVIFAILGMAGFFTASAKTPVSSLLIVSELTGGYALLLPSMWVCALAYLASRPWSMFTEQVKNRMESPAHRGDFIIDVLQGLKVNEALGPAHRRFRTVPLDMPLTELAQMITSTLQSSFPAVDAQGHYYGLFSIQDIRQFLYDSDLGGLAVAQDLASADVEPLTTQTNLSEAISRFGQTRFDELPVVEPENPEHVVALLRRQDIVSLYNRRLIEMRQDGETSFTA